VKCPKCGSSDLSCITTTAVVSDSGVLQCNKCGKMFNMIFGVAGDEKRQSTNDQEIQY
jgi:transcription elongation factor Elf1